MTKQPATRDEILTSLQECVALLALIDTRCPGAMDKVPHSIDIRRDALDTLSRETVDGLPSVREGHFD